MGLPLQTEGRAWSLVSALTPSATCAAGHVVPVTTLSTPSCWGVVSRARFCRDPARFMPFMGRWGAGVHS